MNLSLAVAICFACSRCHHSLTVKFATVLTLALAILLRRFLAGHHSNVTPVCKPKMGLYTLHFSLNIPFVYIYISERRLCSVSSI